MKKTINMVVLCVALSCSGNVYGAYDCSYTSSNLPSGYSLGNPYLPDSKCTNTSSAYYCSDTYKVCDKFYMCSSCSSGYYPTTTTIKGELCNSVAYSRCCKPCTDCGGATNDWEYYNESHQRRTIQTCNCDGTCSTTYEYRCYIGYYGSPSDSASGCTKCPGKGYANPGSKYITNCFIIPGTTLNDETGEYTFTDECYYTE